MRIPKNYLVYTTLIAAAALNGSASAATSQLVFGINPPTSGSISYAGGSSPLTGTSISVDNIIGINTPNNSSVSSQCISCTLNFSSGSFVNYNAPTQTWNFNGGGAITVTGGVDLGANSSVDIPVNTTLLSGAFNSASVTKLPTGFFDFRIAAGSFTDMKDAALLAFYGLPIGANYAGGLGLTFSAQGIGNAFTSTSIFGGSIVNAPVPVPAAIWLMLSALGGLFGFVPKKTTFSIE